MDEKTDPHMTTSVEPGRATPFTDQKMPPRNGSWPILMIEFGPVSRPRSEASGGDVGWSKRPGRGLIDLRKSPNARCMATPKSPDWPLVPACQAIIKIGQEPT